MRRHSRAQELLPSLLLLVAAYAFHSTEGRGMLPSHQLIAPVKPDDGTTTTASVHWSPYFCNKLDCPKYEVLRTWDSEYTELRRYDAAKWVDTKVGDWESFEKAAIIGFHRLFKYILGFNTEGDHIDMTAPVVYTLDVKHPGDKEVDFEDRIHVSLYLPERYQDSGAPEPRDIEVKVRDIPESDFYVRSFDGYATACRIKEVATRFYDELHEHRHHRVEDTYFFIAVYDPPLKLIDRYNEIWVLKRKRKDGDKEEEDDVEGQDLTQGGGGEQDLHEEGKKPERQTEEEPVA